MEKTSDFTFDRNILDIILNIEPILNTFSEFLKIQDLIRLKKISKEYHQHLKLNKKIKKILKPKQQEILFNYSHFTPRTYQLGDLFGRFNHELKNEASENYRKEGYYTPTFYLLQKILTKDILAEIVFPKLGVRYGDIIIAGERY